MFPSRSTRSKLESQPAHFFPITDSAVDPIRYYLDTLPDQPNLIWTCALCADMEFDRFSIALLVLRPDRPRLDKKGEAALQDAHMAHLADLHEAGYLLAAGPLLGGSDEAFRGLTILNV